MGRLIVLLFIIAVIVLVWKAFGPKTWQNSQPPAIKGPDDDPDFLWELDKQRFKQRQELDREDPRDGRRDGREGRRKADEEGPA